jgi:single-strand DNA-binding protein
MEITAVLTGDALVRTTKTDKKVVAFSVVINDDYKDKAGNKKEQRTFVNCSYWRSTGITPFLVKGSVVTVSGRIGINAYKKSDGDFKANLTFTADNIKLISTPKKAGTSTTPASGNKQTNNGEAVDDLPF